MDYNLRFGVFFFLETSTSIIRSIFFRDIDLPMVRVHLKKCLDTFDIIFDKRVLYFMNLSLDVRYHIW